MELLWSLSKAFEVSGSLMSVDIGNVIFSKGLITKDVWAYLITQRNQFCDQLLMRYLNHSTITHPQSWIDEHDGIGDYGEL